MFGIISCKATWSWIFVCREFFVFVFFNYRFYFTSSDQSVQFIFSQFSFGGLYLSFGGLYLCPFLLSCQICWLIIVHSILIRFFLFLQYQLKFLLFHFLIYLDSIFVLLGETGQRFVNFLYPFKDPVLDFTDFFFGRAGSLSCMDFLWFWQVGITLAAVHRLLIGMASLVSEHGLSGTQGFSSCSSWTLGHSCGMQG